MEAVWAFYQQYLGLISELILTSMIPVIGE